MWEKIHFQFQLWIIGMHIWYTDFFENLVKQNSLWLNQFNGSFDLRKQEKKASKHIQTHRTKISVKPKNNQRRKNTHEILFIANFDCYKFSGVNKFNSNQIFKQINHTVCRFTRTNRNKSIKKTRNLSGKMDLGL